MDNGFESKTHLLAILDNMPFMAWYKDNKGIFIAVNQPFADSCGKTKEEIIGKTDFDVWPYELAIKYVNDDLEVINTQKKKSVEEELENKDGVIWLETLRSPIFDDNGDVIGTIGMSIDISKSKHFQLELENQKNIEKQLKESEMRLNLATGSAMIGLWDWNLLTGNTIYNEQWANIIGYSLSELQPIGIQTWIRNTHPDDLEKSNDLLLKHFNGEIEYYENEIRLKHKNGQWIWVLDRGKVIEWDSQKNPIRMVGTHIDITERKLIEEELKRKEKILSAAAFSIKELLENRDYLDAISKCFELIGTATQVSRMYLFVNTYDDEGIYTSEKLEWNFGTYKSKLNKSKLENIPFEDLDDLISILKNNKPFNGVTKELEKCKIRDLLKSRETLSFIIFPIFVERVFWGFIGLDECKYERNWTESEFSTLSAFTTSIGKTIERDLIEKTLETSRQNAEKANMLKSQFLANMSHEIRTPMHAILGYTSLLKDIVENDESLNYLNSIQIAGNMLMNLITDILDLSKIESGKLELQTGYVDIRRLFDDIKEIFSLKIENKNIKIYMDIDSKIPRIVLMDEVRIRQILFNLVGNAVKFTEEGLITVSAYVSNFNANDNLLSLTFKVQDTGIGIPEDQQSSIFNPFKQKDGQNNKKYGGTGLGLSISKRLIDIMNGSLSLISKVDKGSTFIIDIPNISIGQLDNKIDSSEIINFEDQLITNNINSSINKELEIENTESINPEMFDKIAKLKGGLWLDCISKNRVRDIKTFASLLLEIGSKYNHDDTIEYAKLLQSYINSFDLKNTKELLKKYPIMLEIYKSNINTE